MIRLPVFHFNWKNRLLLSFVGGFFLGIIYANFFGRNYLENVSFVSDYFQIRYLQEDVDKSRLFPYLLKGRGFSFFLIWLMGSSFLGSVMIYIILGWVGFSIGIYLIAAIIKFGLSGLVFCVAVLFPQALFYIPAFGLVLWQAYQVNHRKVGISGQKSRFFSGKSGSREVILGYIVVLFLGMLLLFLGILTESYVNPQILKNLLEKF